jgi:hypothetical protein
MSIDNNQQCRNCGSEIVIVTLSEEMRRDSSDYCEVCGQHLDLGTANNQADEAMFQL